MDFAPPHADFRTSNMSSFQWQPDAHVSQLLDAFIQTRWPGKCRVKDVSVSPYTMTADQSFVLDRLPGLPQVALFAADCGRGFKFSVLLSK